MADVMACLRMHQTELSWGCQNEMGVNQ